MDAAAAGRTGRPGGLGRWVADLLGAALTTWLVLRDAAVLVADGTVRSLVDLDAPGWPLADEAVVVRAEAAALGLVGGRLTGGPARAVRRPSGDG